MAVQWQYVGKQSWKRDVQAQPVICPYKKETSSTEYVCYVYTHLYILHSIYQTMNTHLGGPAHVAWPRCGPGWQLSAGASFVPCSWPGVPCILMSNQIAWGVWRWKGISWIGVIGHQLTECRAERLVLPHSPLQKMHMIVAHVHEQLGASETEWAVAPSATSIVITCFEHPALQLSKRKACTLIKPNSS